MLFNAHDRYTVMQTGSATLEMYRMFDGKFSPSYTTTAPTGSNPTIIEISGLPKSHTQTGGWIGWSTRYWPAKRFKIEGYDEYYNNGWTVLADYENTDFSGSDYIVKCKAGAYTKLRYTFYEATGTDGRLGVSELYFIHPEATTPYKGLFTETNQIWQQAGSDISYSGGSVTVNSNGKTIGLSNLSNGWLKVGSTLALDNNEIMFGQNAHIGTVSSNNMYFITNGQKNMTMTSGGNIGIGTTNPGSYKLAVEGVIGAHEIKVTTDGWADFVFEPDYKLMTLADLKAFISENKHLPEIPTTKEVEENGISVGEMNAKLLQKIEELTLYTIQQEEIIHNQLVLIKDLIKRVENLEKK